MKSFPYLFCLLIGLSCSSQQKEVSKIIEDENSSIEDTILTAEYYQDLNELVDYLDSSRNPYLTQNSDVDLSCIDVSLPSQHKKCIIDQFRLVEFPVHVGPTHVVPRANRAPLEDSLFIYDCIKDTNYFTAEERMYSYYYGKKISESENFILVMLLEEFSVGRKYLLLSISSKDFSLIDKITLGAEISDSKSIFGQIKDRTHFEIDTKEFGYDDGQDLMFFKSEQTKKYEVAKNGKFLEL